MQKANGKVKRNFQVWRFFLPWQLQPGLFTNIATKAPRHEEHQTYKILPRTFERHLSSPPRLYKIKTLCLRVWVVYE